MKAIFPQPVFSRKQVLEIASLLIDVIPSAFLFEFLQFGQPKGLRDTLPSISIDYSDYSEVKNRSDVQVKGTAMLLIALGILNNAATYSGLAPDEEHPMLILLENLKFIYANMRENTTFYSRTKRSEQAQPVYRDSSILSLQVLIRQITTAIQGPTSDEIKAAQ